MSAAVEAAARAWFDRTQAERLDAGRKRPDGQLWQWEDLTEGDKVGYRALVQPIVAAALGPVAALADLGVREQWPPDEWRAGITLHLAPVSGASHD